MDPARQGRAAAPKRVGLFACLLLIASLLVQASGAWATGELTYKGCLNDDGSSSCADLPGSPLAEAFWLAVSPDGTSVYVVSDGAHSISRFDRLPAGQLAYDGCLSDDGSGGDCLDLPGTPMTFPQSVAVSPDGTSVYVVAAGSNSIVHFFRHPQGQLFFDGCLSDGGAGGCAALPGPSLATPQSVAVSPDGKSVYVASFDANSISRFALGPAGQLTFADCFADDASGGCTDLPGTPLTGAYSVTVSPDGKSVYVAADEASSVSRFDRASTGALTFMGCLADDASGGCTDLPGTPIQGALSVAVSPNGKSAYVTATANNSVARFDRASTGELTFKSCLSDGGSGCTALPAGVFVGPNEVAVSPDGKSVYATTSTSESIARFNRDRKGRITFADCFSDDGTAGHCTDLPGSPLQGSASVAVSPEGNSVYVASNIADSISRFERRLAPPQTKIRSATIDPKKGTASFTFSSSEKGSTFRCKLGSNPFRACSSPKVYESLRQGTYVFEVRARNSQGTLDPTPATSKFTITG